MKLWAKEFDRHWWSFKISVRRWSPEPNLLDMGKKETLGLREAPSPQASRRETDISL